MGRLAKVIGLALAMLGIQCWQYQQYNGIWCCRISRSIIEVFNLPNGDYTIRLTTYIKLTTVELQTQSSFITTVV